MDKNKPFSISKQAVWQAYEKVKANKGAAGVDEQSLEQFEQDRNNNLYKLWNRLSSGSYFPAPVKLVEIPKKGGVSVRWECPPWRTESPRRWSRRSWKRSWTRSSTTTRTATGRAGAHMTRWRHAGSAAGSSTEPLIWTSSPSSTPSTISGYSRRSPTTPTGAGPAVHRAVARCAAPAAGGQPGLQGSRHPAGVSDLSRAGEPPLRVRCVDATGVLVVAVRALRR